MSIKKLISKFESFPVIDDPFPILIFNNIFDFNGEWPEDKYFKNDDIYIQNSRNIKKTIVQGTKTWNEIMKKYPVFLKMYNIFNSIDVYKHLYHRFYKHIKKHMTIDIKNIIPKVSMDFNLCETNYDCKIHCDRRDHIFSLLLYPQSNQKNTTSLNIYKLKNDTEIYEVFVNPTDVKIDKSIDCANGNGVIFLNTPFAYHSVTQTGDIINNKRKYIYISYDFDIVKNKKEGCNKCNIWRKKSCVNKLRRYSFLN